MTVEVSIISADLDPAWSLEVINDVGTSTDWDEQFETDDQAYAAFRLVVEEEGMQAFLDQPEVSNIIPFSRRHWLRGCFTTLPLSSINRTSRRTSDHQKPRDRTGNGCAVLGMQAAKKLFYRVFRRTAPKAESSHFYLLWRAICGKNRTPFLVDAGQDLQSTL